MDALTVNNSLVIIAALMLDLAAGDPVYPFHPARIAGYTAAAGERVLFKLNMNGYAGGAVYWAGVVCIAGAVFIIPYYLLKAVNIHFSLIYKLFVIYSFVSVKDMRRHALLVYQALCEKDVSKAQKRVAEIVGRDTEGMDEKEISKACIESVAESSNDGVTAPLFYAVLFGLPGIVLYKTVNTLDSMVGYKSSRYRKFGWLSAKADDLANYIPARLNLFFVLLVSGLSSKTWSASVRDSGRHTSPNSGWSESGFAHVLGVALGGISRYSGKEIVKPVINTSSRGAEPEDIKGAVTLMYRILIPVFIVLLTLTLTGVYL